MPTLGIRCSNNDYSFAVLNGDKANPVIIEKGYVAFPKHYSRPAELKWFLLEIQSILTRHKISVIVVKGTEGIATRGASFVSRIENETIIFLAAADSGIKHVFRKTKNSIAKELCHKGKSKYLASLNYSCFPDFDKEDVKMQEAIIAAWSCVK